MVDTIAPMAIVRNVQKWLISHHIVENKPSPSNRQEKGTIVEFMKSSRQSSDTSVASRFASFFKLKRIEESAAAGSSHFARWLNSSFPAVKPSTLGNHHLSTFCTASEKAETFWIYFHLHRVRRCAIFMAMRWRYFFSPQRCAVDSSWTFLTIAIGAMVGGRKP